MDSIEHITPGEAVFLLQGSSMINKSNTLGLSSGEQGKNLIQHSIPIQKCSQMLRHVPCSGSGYQASCGVPSKS
jgi:hypothetical protein